MFFVLWPFQVVRMEPSVAVPERVRTVVPAGVLMAIFHDTGLERSKSACHKPPCGSAASVCESRMDGDDAVIGSGAMWSWSSAASQAAASELPSRANSWGMVEPLADPRSAMAVTG